MSDVTRILSESDAQDPAAAEQLLPLVYDELRRLAATRLAQERAGHTMQATALVHEAYLRLVGGDNPPRDWDHRGHFFAAAAEAMRRILVEQARRRKSLKGGGGRRRVPLAVAEIAVSARKPDVLALNEVLDRLEAQDSRAAQLVKLRFFVGMTLSEASQALGISLATAKTDWSYAKAWLQAALLEQTNTLSDAS